MTFVTRSDREERTREKCRETRYKCEPSFTMEKQGRSILRTRCPRSPRAGTYVHLASARAAFHSAGTFGAHAELTAINTGRATVRSLRLSRTRQKLAALPTGKTRRGNARIIATRPWIAYEIAISKKEREKRRKGAKTVLSVQQLWPQTTTSH